MASNKYKPRPIPMRDLENVDLGREESATAVPGPIPDLTRFEIPDVAFTGEILGEGAYGRVEEVTIPRDVCKDKGIVWSCHGFAAKQLHCTRKRGEYKLLSDALVKECHLMSKASHPNLVKFLGICYQFGSDLPALVMERLNSSFHEELEKKSRKFAAFESRLSILIDVAKGIVYLHGWNPSIAHRDLTAKNILISSDGKGKISDLGVSKILMIPSLSKSICHTKNPGNAAYMPPEATENRAKYDTSIDVFSFGVVALFAGTQNFPLPESATYYDKRARRVVARTEIERRRKSFVQLSKFFHKSHPFPSLVRQCLEYCPEKRPSAIRIQRCLEGLLAVAPKEFRLKVVLLGNSSVGKTALAQQYVLGNFSENAYPTIGESFCTKTVPISDTAVTAVVWDTAGQERYHAIAPMTCRNVDACLLVYDIKDRFSLESVERFWLPKIKEYSPEAVCILVGNRTDKREHRKEEVDLEEGETFAERHNLKFFETSAKTSENVTEAFGHVIQDAFQKTRQRAPQTDPDMRVILGDDHGNRSTKSRCCSKS